MGEIRKILVNKTLPPRDKHHARLFVDLCENVHIHFRDIRTVFSTDEFFEYVDTVTRSAKDLRRYLRWHPQYREQEIFSPIMVALGPEQQTRPLGQSPQPNQSTYFDARLQIELQAESVIDEIHIHFRDYRLAMSREVFRAFAEAMGTATVTLDGFLDSDDYRGTQHPFRQAVVDDPLYEARGWKGPFGSSKIAWQTRARALAYYAGGARGEAIVRNAARKVRRLLGQVVELLLNVGA